MQQLTWFPPGRAQPGWTPPRNLQQTYLQDFAALDLSQASQFAAAQALGSSVVWRGSVLLLVSSALHGMSLPCAACKATGSLLLNPIGVCICVKLQASHADDD